MSGVSGDFPVHLATATLDLGAFGTSCPAPERNVWICHRLPHRLHCMVANLQAAVIVFNFGWRRSATVVSL